MNATLLVDSVHTRQLAATSVELWNAVESAREGGNCVTLVLLTLEIDNEGWKTIKQLEQRPPGHQGEWRRRPPRSETPWRSATPAQWQHQGAKRHFHSFTAIGSQLFVVGGFDNDADG